MTNPFQPINHIVAEVSALLVSIMDNLNSFPHHTCVEAQFCPGLFLKNEKEMEMTRKGEEAAQDGVPEPKSKLEDEEDEEEESERQTPESPESGQYRFSVIAPSVD